MRAMLSTEETPGVEGPVKGGGTSEHAGHVGDRGDVPGVEGLVEGGGEDEHVGHVGDRGDVPGVEVAVEGGGAPEHFGHVGDKTQIWRVSGHVDHVGGPSKGVTHVGPGYAAPLVYRGKLGYEAARGIRPVQCESCQAAGHRDHVVACIYVGVSLGSREVRLSCAVAPGDVHAGSHKVDGDARVCRFRPPRGDKRQVLPLDGDAECPRVAFLSGVGLEQYGRSSYDQRIYVCRWQVCRVKREYLVVHDKPGVIYRVCGHTAVQVTVLRPDGKHRVGSQDGRVLHHVPVPEVLGEGGGAEEHVGHAGHLRDVP